jgi:NitT/TauT family transport system ATP-binding protein
MRTSPRDDGAHRVVPLRPASRVPAPAVPSAPTVLAIDSLTLAYPAAAGELTAVDSLSLRVGRGERCMLLGRSGCGKSSLLKAVAGFIRPSAGRILIDGRSVGRPGPDRVLVFQEFDQLPPWKTVLENIALPLRIARHRAPADSRAAAREWLELVGLADVADQYPHTLSGGMKQRVAIARALALEPAMLLMDEPFAALDALTRRRMQDEVLRLSDELGFTMLFVTHSIDEALLLGTRICVLTPRPGRVLADIERSHLGPGWNERLAERIRALLVEDGRDASPDVR